MSDMNYPKISIITPSFNQGQYLEETILSVLGQNYPNLEYIIIDGGSTDNSVDIIKKYEKKLAFWISEPDNGQSHAINKGFTKASGEILAWLNSDDMYLPGVLNYIAKEIKPGNPGIYFGDCVHFRYQDAKLTCKGSHVSHRHRDDNLELNDYIIQPSTFWTAKTLDIVGNLNENLHYGFDWEWFLRAKRVVPFFPIQKPLSIYRLHKTQKTGKGGKERQTELAEIYAQFNPRINKLYNLLCNERHLQSSVKMKLYLRFMRLFKEKPSRGLALKTLYVFKYRGYTISEIDQVIPMR